MLVESDRGFNNNLNLNVTNLDSDPVNDGEGRTSGYGLAYRNRYAGVCPMTENGIYGIETIITNAINMTTFNTNLLEKLMKQ